MKPWLRALAIVALILGMLLVAEVVALTQVPLDQVHLRINGESIAWPADAEWAQLNGLQAAIAVLVTVIVVPLAILLGIGLPLLAVLGATLAVLAASALAVLIVLSPLLLLVWLITRLVRSPKPVA